METHYALRADWNLNFGLSPFTRSFFCKNKRVTVDGEVGEFRQKYGKYQRCTPSQKTDLRKKAGIELDAMRFYQPFVSHKKDGILALYKFLLMW
ncbi:MAG: hypothetical protein RSE33_20490 [Hafnia sp.]